MIIEDDEIVDSEYIYDDESKILKTAAKWKDITIHELKLFISKFIINFSNLHLNTHTPTS